jgi:xylan 1,4-beta-xylosidase
MFNSLREFVKILKEFPRYEKTEFINDESDIVWNGNWGTSHKSWLNFRNTHYAPGFTAKMVWTYCSVLEDELQVNLSIVDSDNCHLAWEKSFFSGNRSQFTPLGPAPCSDIIRKPVFNIFPLLAKLGTERYLINPPDEEYGVKYGALPTRDGEKGYAVMLWNFEDGLAEDVNERCIRLHLTNTEAAEYHLLHFRIDGSHSNAYGAWCKMGRPYPLKPDQIRSLRDCEGLELAEKPKTVKGGARIELEISIPMHGVSLIKLVKALPPGKHGDERAIRNGAELLREEGFTGNTQVFIRWDYSASADLAGYRVYRKKSGETAARCINKSESAQCSWYVDMDVEKDAEYSYSASVLYADGSESPRSPERSLRC